MAQIFFDPKNFTLVRRTTASKLSANGLKFKMWGQCAVLISGEIPVTVRETERYYDIAIYPYMSLPNLIDYIRKHQKEPAGLPIEYKANALYFQAPHTQGEEFEKAWDAIHAILQKLASF